MTIHWMKRGCAALLCLYALSCGDNNTQLLPIGSPCTANSLCGTGTLFYCDKDHPNGYCKRDCKVDTDCPVEAVCAHDGVTSGACHKRCDTATDCRKAEGYICKPSSTDPVTLATHAYCDVSEATPDDGGMATPDGGNKGG